MRTFLGILGVIPSILVCSALLSCSSTGVDEQGREILKYRTAWGTSHTMSVNPLVERHPYNLKKLKRRNLRYTYSDGRYEIRHGMDVSRYEGKIDWEKAREDGIEFVIIRIAYRRYGSTGQLVLDENFHENFKGAKAAGLPVGVYVFSQAINEKEAVEEAQIIIDNVSPSELELPAVFDPEFIRGDEARTDGLTSEQLTRNAVAFCEKIKEAGFKPMLYCNLRWQDSWLDLTRLGDYEIWFADYMKRPQTPYRFTFWQYSEKGRVDGITKTDGNGVDLDLWFVPKGE